MQARACEDGSGLAGQLGGESTCILAVAVFPGQSPPKTRRSVEEGARGTAECLLRPKVTETGSSEAGRRRVHPLSSRWNVHMSLSISPALLTPPKRTREYETTLAVWKERASGHDVDCFETVSQ